MSGIPFAKLVLPNGKLDKRLVASREILYTSPGGKAVERFTFDDGTVRRSFIFKPLTNDGLAGREDWVQRYLLPLVPLRFPRMLSISDTRDPDRYWSFFEDLGTLSHRHDAGVLTRAAELVRRLHRLPPSLLTEPFSPQKPLLAEVADCVIVHNERLAELLVRFGMPVTVVDGLVRLLLEGLASFEDETVICHGDLHMGNVAEKDGEIIILDWEHVHLNSIYWDLFNLLDMTHPDFRRTMSPATRVAVLDAYLTERRSEGWQGDALRFCRHYYFYAAMYAAWMLLLIEDDLAAGRWNPEGLTAQRSETFAALESCAYELLDNKE
jgi:thiamine kinase-like enzyme